MPDNTVTLVGNVTRDPELRFTPSGQAVATFGLAVNRRWQNRQTNEWEEQTSFFDVKCWAQMAENVGRVAPPRAPASIVTGRLEQRSWETEEGEKRSKVEVVADEIAPEPALGDRRGHQERAARAAARAAAPVAAAAGRQQRRRAGRRRPRRRRCAATTTTRSPSDGHASRSAARTRTTPAAAKKKISILTQERVEYVDYKDVNLLRRFMSDRAKIRARRVTGNDAQQQADDRHGHQERPRDGAAALHQPGHAAAWRPRPWRPGRSSGPAGRRAAAASRPRRRPRLARPTPRWTSRSRPQPWRRRRRWSRRTRPDARRPADRRRRRRQEGRRRRRRRRLRPQLPPAQGPGHQGHARRRGAGRGDARARAA